ncbi:hypothetical protein [Microbacterium sp. KSW4-4]|uniref:hypothetical protein n=1 Tax=Microbacterium sp. KSW4-4 TaxID=2851651 RepID=UPI001FFD9A36|nr:hypothetical protein [Microbacterium sp. KSW4-4]MCK2034467.1 hypothetical protein [Microbacterium sp. KSW4-4]
MQEAADALMANQGAIVNSIIERTRHEPTDDEREAEVKSYSGWDADEVARYPRIVADVIEQLRTRLLDEFRRSDVPEPSAGSLDYYDPARQDRISEHDCVFEDGEWWFGHGMPCKHPKLHPEPQGEPSEREVVAALEAWDEARAALAERGDAMHVALRAARGAR